MADEGPVDPGSDSIEGDGTPEDRPRRGLPIVGIGASAGGLAALQSFFSRLPADSGAGFVVVSHHQAGRRSLLPELLSRSANIDVAEATDGVVVQPDRAYVAPPGVQIQLERGRLVFVDPEQAGPSLLSIDRFLRSLAGDAKQRAVAIILSGSGTDGTLGIQAVKADGGLVVVQDEASAEFTGMPASARSTGLADFVLPPEEMPERLAGWVRGPYLTARPSEPSPPSASGEDLGRILSLLRARVGRDFSGYKPGTLLRRVERRQSLHQLESLSDYVRMLEGEESEVQALFEDLLIGVTSFFRDAQAFETLVEPLSSLLTSLPDHAVVRAWVPGCSTGEEAYSLAILIRECLDRLDKPLHAQIFATDIDPQAIETARRGRYPLGIASDLSKQRLARFFVEEDGLYQVRSEIREMLVFACQDILTDPPFTRVDVVSCRNVLIYLNGELQRRVLAMLHYALNPGGLLMLGSSESTLGVDHLFTSVERSWKLYRRSESAGASPLAALPSYRPPKRPQPLPPRREQPAEDATRLLARSYAPPSVLIDGRNEVVHIHGHTGAFLEPAQGRANLNLLEMARNGLRPVLAWLLREVARGGGHPSKRDVRITVNGTPHSATVVAHRVEPPDPLAGLILICFEERGPLPEGESAAPQVSGTDTDLAEHLPQASAAALEQARRDLQATVEELQSANEELASSNEEVQATNEELQSANEELETSREEMQSLNEELQTVNAELRAKVEEFSQASDDIENLLNSTSVATLFLDRELRIKRFTADISRIVRIQASDVGRPIADLTLRVDRPNLHEDAEQVLRSLVPMEVELTAEEGLVTYLMRVGVYRTRQNVIDGVVVTFVDVTRQKELEKLAGSIVQTVRQPLLTLDADLRVQSANPAFCDLFSTSAEEVVGRTIFSLPDARWDVPKLRELLYEIIPRNAIVDGYELECDLPVAGQRTVCVDARTMAGRGERPTMILMALSLGSRKEATR